MAVRMGVALDLYEADSDEDSSMGGSGIMGQGIDRRDDMSDAFSLDSDLMERYDAEDYDYDSHLQANAYNPSGLRIGVGTAVNIDGDSDDDGKSIGNDSNYEPLTIDKSRVIGGGMDVDEHSIGSDDDFAPAVHSTFPKNKITKSDKDFENHLSAHDGTNREDADADSVDLIDFGGGDDGDDGGGGGRGGGRGGGAGGRGGGGGERRYGGHRRFRDRESDEERDEEEERRGGGGGAVGRAPQPEVVQALARARAGRGGGAPSSRQAELDALVDSIPRRSRADARGQAQARKDADEKAKAEAEAKAKAEDRRRVLKQHGKVEAVVGGKVVGTRRTPEAIATMKPVDREALAKRRQIDTENRRKGLEEKGLPAFRRGIRSGIRAEQELAEVRAEQSAKHRQYLADQQIRKELADKEELEIPDTDFWFERGGKVGKNEQTYNVGWRDGLLVSTVSEENLEKLEEALEEAQGIEPRTEKIETLIAKIKSRRDFVKSKLKTAKRSEEEKATAEAKKKARAEAKAKAKAEAEAKAKAEAEAEKPKRKLRIVGVGAGGGGGEKA